MKKYNLLALIISFIITTGLLLWMLILVSNTHIIDKEGVGLDNFKNFQEIILAPDTDLSQEIFSTQNELTKLTISLKSTKPSTLSLELQKENHVVRQHSINIPQLSHVQFIEWLFDPITDSRDKKYLLNIKTGTQITLFTVEPERYDGGNLYINGPINDQERVIIDWEYFAAHPINTLINRITYTKPSIFNKTPTIVLLLTLFWIMNFIMLYQIIKFFINSGCHE
jgi:hypothetical protein